MRITQNITYHCYNSRAWEEEDDRTIKLQGDNDMELTSSDKTKPKVVTNSCDVSSHFHSRGRVETVANSTVRS